jgi:hypothetical protein
MSSWFHYPCCFVFHQHSYERSHVIKNGQVVTTEKEALSASTHQGTIYLIGGKTGGTAYQDATSRLSQCKWVNTYKHLSDSAASYNVITATATSFELSAKNVDGTAIDHFVITK